jgi:Putative motility protein
MDTASVGSLNTALSMAQNGDAVGTLMLKKALKMQEQSAMQLIQALPQPTASNPPNLGNSVDVRA